MKRKNELFFVSVVLIAAFGVLAMGSVEPVSASCGVPCVPSVSCSCGSVSCEARLSLPTNTQACPGTNISIPLSIDEFSPWLLPAYNISAESDLRNAYTAAVTFFLFSDPGDTLTVNDLVDNGYNATEGVNLEIINGTESNFEMETYHTCGDKIYTVEISGPPFTESAAPGFGGIESIEIDVEFNAAVLASTDATLAGILANDGYTIDTDGATNGVVTVTITDTQNAQSTVNGVFAYLNFNVVGNEGDSTNLIFTEARINNTPVGTIAGLFEVTGNCGDPSVSLVVDFGPSWGLFGYDENDLWTLLNSNDPDAMVTADIDNDGQDELAVSFPGMGLYIWDGTGWNRINDVPEKMIEFNSGLMLDFGSEWGLFRYNEANGWTLLNNNDPYDMVAADIDSNGQDELAVSFVSDTPEIEGLYIWNNGWSKINNTVPEKMIEFNGGLILDFASLGLFGYENDLWTPLNSYDPGAMVATDIDSDGQDELAVSFPGMGLYIWDGAGWSRINDVPEKMIEFNNGLMLDFGSGWGLFRYTEANGCTPLNNNDPDIMVAADIDGDGQDELAVSFVGLTTPSMDGMYIWDEENGWSKINDTAPEGMIALEK